MGELKPYPEYKDSGIVWIGNIPKSWNVTRLKNLFHEIDRRSTTGKEPLLRMSKTRGLISYDEISQKPSSAKSLIGYKICKPNEIVMNKMQAWNGVFALATRSGLVSPEYTLLQFQPHANPYFFIHLLKTPLMVSRFLIESQGVGSGFLRLYTDRFGRIPVVLPSKEDQEKCFRFIDAFDREIINYIFTKRHLIELLNEQKQVIINRTVTRGFDPNVRLKPSGIEWLGDVPETWEVTPLRRYFDVIDCKHLTVPFFEDGVPLASVREVQKFDLDLSNAKKTSQHYYELMIQGGRKPHRGDIIYCRNASVGAAAYVNTDIEFAMGQDVCLIRSDKQNTRFLNYQLNYWIGKQQLNTLLIGSTIKRMNVADIKNLIVLQPPKEEQEKIVEFLDKTNEEINQSISSIKLEIEKIREYQTRFISDVVTGKVDVRNVEITEYVNVVDDNNNGGDNRDSMEGEI